MKGITEREEMGKLGRREGQRLKESLLLEEDMGGGLVFHWDQTVGTGGSIGLAHHRLSEKETAMRNNLLLSYLENSLLKSIESEGIFVISCFWFVWQVEKEQPDGMLKNQVKNRLYHDPYHRLMRIYHISTSNFVFSTFIDRPYIMDLGSTNKTH
ncbi:PREDICTED: uncharacterized protein LOC105130159 isoform X2 [Populus euphratica]|uniref:Uncharacterized protein LOC105130159 isoform X2 n=1 Tax=Populus euphratica TaxID=75702 RepID=A0AAJ6UK50_POPEU|nr:PREDICTED: uncharacterized protein LOC105130159 isoform X2 [Populus euphratica]